VAVSCTDGYVPLRVAEWLERELDLAVVRHEGQWALRSYDGLAYYHRIPWDADRMPSLSEALSALAAQG
jgi:hypothetical protein